jgi:hypothetical protein
MATTLEDIKKLLDSGNLPFDLANIVHNGTINGANGASKAYQIHHGLDLVLARSCDNQWGKFNVNLMSFISKQNYDAATLKQVLSEIQVDDSHWEWLIKSLKYRTSEYDWFFLVAEGAPQGACLIFHPKPSALDKGDIFYIEYIATAPWNRRNPMCEQVFKSVGTILVRHAVNYAHNTLKLRYGFSLHALPSASWYYNKIGMTRHAPHDKTPLQYFEMSENVASSFVGA